MTNFLLSAASFTAVLLLFGAWQLWKRDGISLRMWLMIGAGLVIIINLAIWITPVGNGKSLVNPTAVDTGE